MHSLVILFLSIAIGLAAPAAHAKPLDCTRWYRNLTCFIEDRSILSTSSSEADQTIITFPAQASHLIIDSSVVFPFSVQLFDALGETTFLTLKGGYIPVVTFRSNRLNSLRIDHTNLHDFTISPVENRNLNTLIVSGNPLAVLPPTMRYLTGLSILDLSNNALESVSLNWFESMANLLVLDLSANRIARVDLLPTLRLPRLKNLWINQNRLRELNHFPDFAPRLHRVRLVENRWSCAWVHRIRAAIWLADVQVYGAEYVCPEKVDGGLCCYDECDECSDEEEEAPERRFQIVNVNSAPEEASVELVAQTSPSNEAGDDNRLKQPHREVPEQHHRAAVDRKPPHESRFMETVRQLESTVKRIEAELKDCR
ncbi:leucine-rich repeat-containing protein 40-like [Anopheles darlingi]|uniref:leucine-rich repeat-containing protein 40-like n=1 Tax=Anopheles darlingi TaxID=43151 RepID=UPI0021003C0C|nr:leucine-rich repeat-containing protein 40-like [Anopheles darlingi]